jgi:hypothetical protein
LCRASTPVNRETHRAETVGSAHILTFASRHRVDGRDERGHDAGEMTPRQPGLRASSRVARAGTLAGQMRYLTVTKAFFGELR